MGGLRKNVFSNAIGRINELEDVFKPVPGKVLILKKRSGNIRNRIWYKDIGKLWIMKIILWRGLLYKSLEHCKIQKQDDGFNVESVIIGHYQHQVYKIDYLIRVNEDWSARGFEIRSEIEGVEAPIAGSKTGEDWLVNGTVRPDLRGLLYIDISLTPFTNSLPVNNLRLEVGQSQDIKVLYVDVLNNEIKAVSQRYLKKGKDLYLYENLAKNFSATIKVDEHGFVKDYPELFEEVARFEAK